MDICNWKSNQIKSNEKCYNFVKLQWENAVHNIWIKFNGDREKERENERKRVKLVVFFMIVNDHFCIISAKKKRDL